VVCWNLKTQLLLAAWTLNVCHDVAGDAARTVRQNVYWPSAVLRQVTVLSKPRRNRNIMWAELLQKIYRTANLPVVLYGCEIWSLTLRAEYRLTVFQNRVVREMFGFWEGRGNREWRKLHNEEHNDLYCSPNIIRVIKSRRGRWAGHVARRRGAYRVLVRGTDRNRHFWRPKRRREGNIKLDL